MRVALGQEVEVFADKLREVEALTVGDETGGAGLQQLDGEGAEVVFEPGAPGELDGVARLEGGRKF
ncbi:hypothetical protein D3C87_1644120 [compost metagenome]